MNTYRVFISYSHCDLELVKSLDKVLRKAGVEPIWDQHLTPGRDFTDQIPLMSLCPLFPFIQV